MKITTSENEQNLGELFLINFISTLIDIKTPTIPLPEKTKSESHNLIPKIQPMSPRAIEDITEQSQHVNPNIKPLSTNPEHQFLSIMHQQTERPLPQLMKKIPQPYKTIPRQFPQIRERALPIQTNPLFNLPNVPLGKIRSFINDPLIREIECPGPGKNIIITKGNSKQTIPIILNSEEIEKIMQEISARTRIPLIQGMFKAALGNILISAVVSEFIGTHFNIQKIPPPMPPYPIRRF